MGIWSYLNPIVKQKHHWIFAKYIETPSERDDGQWYTVLHFRDENRTVFGIVEFIRELQGDRRLLVMAKRIVADAEFRKSLISNDKTLKTWWKKKH